MQALMQLYMFDVHQQLEMQCGLEPPMLRDEFSQRLREFRHEAGDEMARVMDDAAGAASRGESEQVVGKLYRRLMTPLDDAKREAMRTREPRW